MINNGAPLEVIQSLLGHVRLLNKAVAGIFEQTLF
ncbi:hypothetical protein ACTHO0_18790 [Cytobacillus praedii]